MPESSSDSAPTPPSAASSAAETGSRGVAALAFSIVALASCWNLFGAPFAIIVAIGALVLCARASARGAPRARVLAAGAVSAGALLGAVAVLLTASGAWGGGAGAPVVDVPAAGELDDTLTGAAEGTQARRERAREELERATGADRTNR